MQAKFFLKSRQHFITLLVGRLELLINLGLDLLQFGFVRLSGLLNMLQLQYIQYRRDLGSRKEKLLRVL